MTVKIDRGPVADLKKPWQTRIKTDKTVTGHIELAYLRGYQAGVEDTMKLIVRDTPP